MKKQILEKHRDRTFLGKRKVVLSVRVGDCKSGVSALIGDILFVALSVRVGDRKSGLSTLIGDILFVALPVRVGDRKRQIWYQGRRLFLRTKDRP